MRILILHGPNLNLIGKREPQIYGNVTFDEYFTVLQEKFPEHALSLFQSNIEGEIVNALQETNGKFDGVVLNAGGYTHTSVAIADAVKYLDIPLVEVHISNISGREEYRNRSLIAPFAAGVIFGFGLQSYNLALHSFVESD